MPCGKESHPELSIIGAGEFQAYKRRCISNDCENRIWRTAEACGFDRVFGKPCPTEANENTTAEWRQWEKRLRGVNEEGKEFHSMEWIPAHGSSADWWRELLPAIKETLPHMWRDDVMQQSVRVYEDRKSGRHLDQLKERRCAELKRRRCALTDPGLLASVIDVVVGLAEQQLDAPVVAQPSVLSLTLQSLRAVQRAVHAAPPPPAALVEDAMAVELATQAVATAQDVFDELATTVTVQSDYASQLETSREFHATCATKERHNYLVTLIGYRSYVERRARFRKARARRVPSASDATDFRSPISVGKAPVQTPSARYPIDDGRSTLVYKQMVDGLFAFHKAPWLSLCVTCNL